MRTIPLDKVDIKILDIEMNHVGQIFEGSTLDLRRHLEKNGYDNFMKVGIDEVRDMVQYRVTRQLPIVIKVLLTSNQKLRSGTRCTY